MNSYRKISLPRINDVRGNLTFLQEGIIPFEPKRIYYLYDVPGGEVRGGHAHKQLQQVMIAVAGSFDLILNNGQKTEKITLNRAYEGIYISRMTWRELENFSSGAVCLVVASHIYEEADYIRDLPTFMAATQNGN